MFLNRIYNKLHDSTIHKDINMKIVFSLIGLYLLLSVFFVSAWSYKLYQDIQINHVKITKLNKE